MIAILALALTALGLSGCPALMLGSLGYQGYKYEKTGKLPGQQDDSSQSSKDEQKPSAQTTPSDSNIE